jgi:hypothetical protein
MYEVTPSPQCIGLCGGGDPVANLGPAQQGETCEGSGKAIGGWVNLVDIKNNEINDIYEVQGVGPGGLTQGTVGWVYTTFGAGNLFQPNLSVYGGVAVVGVSAGSPLFAMGPLTPYDLDQVFQTALKASGSISGLPPYFQVGSKILSQVCFWPPWSG